MSTLPLPRGAALLRLALKADALVTGLNGAAYAAAAPVLAGLLGLSPGLLRGIGAFLLVYTVAVAMVAMQDRPHRAAVLAVIALNTVWAVDSLVFAGLGWGSPTAVGTVWIVLQAIVVAAFATLQLVGLRLAQGEEG